MEYPRTRWYLNHVAPFIKSVCTIIISVITIANLLTDFNKPSQDNQQKRKNNGRDYQ